VLTIIVTVCITFAVQEAATQYLQRERDAMIHVKETMDNDENSLLQLDAEVNSIKCRYLIGIAMPNSESSRVKSRR